MNAIDVTHVDTRAVSDPIFPAQWKVECRLYGDTWTTVADGLDLFTAAAHANWMAGNSPSSPLTLS